MRIIYLALLMIVSSYVSAAPPTVPASNLGFYTVDGGYFNIGWTPGNGAKRILICKSGSPVTFKPQNAVAYTANTVFGSGQEVAPGEFVIYNGGSTSFFVTGLTAATQYYFAMFEYNGAGDGAEYLTSSFLTGNAATSAMPTTQVSNAVFNTVTSTSVTVSWTNGNGLRRIIFMKEGAAVDAEPVNNTAYIDNSNFGSGSEIGSGNFAVYRSSDASTTIRNLKPGTEYHLAFYEFNGSSQPQYKMPAYTTTVTTRSMPTIASSNVAITKTDGKELTLTWTNGNGQRRIVVAKKGSDVTAVPANNTVYQANAAFGSGTALAPGEYVVFDDNFNIATISQLDPSATYYFRVFEYDGGSGNAAYLTSSFGSVNGSTAFAPTIQSSAVNAAIIGSNSIRLTLAPGNGRARIIVARKDLPVNFVPQDFTPYTANTDFGSGTDLGNGNYVVSNTTDLTATIYQLEPNTTYQFAIFEYNGYNQPLYLKPAAVFSAKTLSPLPVKLLKWDALVENNQVKLEWTTSTEINSSHFIIQRSADAVNFSDIVLVPAAGNSQLPVKYSQDDLNPLKGRSFYRLKMVDKDGSFEYSGIVTAITGDNNKAFIMENPVQQVLELITPQPAAGCYNQWQIVDISGQAIKKGTMNSTGLSLNVASLSSGHYWLRLFLNKEIHTLAFIKR